jgi:hypothetical protein
MDHDLVVVKVEQSGVLADLRIQVLPVLATMTSPYSALGLRSIAVRCR